jgi:hypothetical protein
MPVGRTLRVSSDTTTWFTYEIFLVAPTFLPRHLRDFGPRYWYVGTGPYDNVLELVRRVFVPLVGLFLICNFVLAAIKLVLNYLLKKQIMTLAPESIVERLLRGPQDEQHKVVKWVALLLSTGTGPALCPCSGAYTPSSSCSSAQPSAS